jgi:hypothetical protein
MKKEEKNWCRYGQVIDDARIMLNSIQTWKVNYVRREANGIAHRLAKEAPFLLDEQVPYVLGILVYIQNP